MDHALMHVPTIHPVLGLEMEPSALPLEHGVAPASRRTVPAEEPHLVCRTAAPDVLSATPASLPRLSAVSASGGMSATTSPPTTLSTLLDLHIALATTNTTTANTGHHGDACAPPHPDPAPVLLHGVGWGQRRVRVRQRCLRRPIPSGVRTPRDLGLQPLLGRHRV